MKRRSLTRATTLVVMLGLAMASLLLLFLLLDGSTVGAASERAGPIPDVRAQNGTFTVSGTVTCEACGATKPISGVEVYVWNRDQGTGFVEDTTDSSGYYSVTLGLPPSPDTYSLEFTPPPETGLNARAFTAIELVADTVLNVDFCVCSGIWVSETVDSADEGGYHHSTSLALASTYPYTPHISYVDASTYPNRLKHAWKSGTTWISQTVESGFGSTSLALVPTYPHTPCILYQGETGQTIKFAYLSGTTWISETIQGYGAEKPTSLALKLADPHNPHVSHYMPPIGGNNLKQIYLSGTTWMSGTWVHETVDDSQGVGGYSSIALEPTYPYTPHISYSSPWGGLKHAWLSDTTWLSETVDSVYSVWVKTSLALDSSGNPRISYHVHSNRDLKYAWLSGTTWLSETVDSEGNVGDWLSLALDSRDNPHISYYDATHRYLKLAHFDGGVWIIQTVDSEGAVGGWSSLALDQADCPHISYGANDDLKYAYLSACKVYFPIILKSY